MLSLITFLFHLNGLCLVSRSSKPWTLTREFFGVLLLVTLISFLSKLVYEAEKFLAMVSTHRMPRDINQYLLFMISQHL